MSPLHRKVKTALDETRLLILGAQVLFGFHLNAVFQPGFPRLDEASHILYIGAFCAMTGAVGLLIAPSMLHRIAERGQSTPRLLRQATQLADLALLPLAFSLGADIAVVLGYRFGSAAGAIVGTSAGLLACSCWYGAGWALRRPDDDEALMEVEVTPIDVRVEHMLTEARVLLPGAQALLGFQMAVLLTDGFGELPAISKVIHAGALCAIALAIVLVMAPAAIHRIAFYGANTEGFLRVGSRFVVASAAPLAIGITGDLYVAVARALNSAVGSAVASVFALLLFVLWFAQPLLLRRGRPA
jgi:hypothetical protein